MEFEENGKLPHYLKEGVQEVLETHNASQGEKRTIAGFLADEDREQSLLRYTGITRTLKEKYREKSDEFGESITVYRLDLIDTVHARLWKLEDVSDTDAEIIWERKPVNRGGTDLGDIE